MDVVFFTASDLCSSIECVCVSFILFIKVLFPVALDDGRGAVITKSCEQVSLLLF